jgi:hypothetical protein
VSLRKQGANKGAVTSFLISTPESGIDSIAVSYALLDPILTFVRPLAAFLTAVVAGLLENLTHEKTDELGTAQLQPDRTCPVDGCCDGVNCPPEVHRRHHSILEKLSRGLRYAFTEFWEDLAGTFFLGLVLAGVISVLVPDRFFTTFLGSGLPAMLIMLAAGIPLYVCATASTPIAAALILKGVSPGAVLVFLLVGPATNMASLTVLLRTLGKRSTALYLAAISLCAVLFGLAVDRLYAQLGMSARASIGHATEALPHWLLLTGAVALLGLSVVPLWRMLKKPFIKQAPLRSNPIPPAKPETDTGLHCLPGTGCGPS